MSDPQVTPEVTWAQRSSTSDPERNYIYLTVVAPDVPASSLKVNLTPTSLSVTGHSETKKTTYNVTLELYGEIDVENSKTNHSPRDVEFKLRKKELNADYWPRLLKESKKQHFLKTDFDKWVDEDEQDGAPEEDFSGGMGGMPDMGGGDGGFGGIDFSKLGGGAGGMPDMGDLGGDEDGEDDGDEEMPELEGEDEDEEVGEAKGKGKEGEAAPASSAKIEEVS